MPGQYFPSLFLPLSQFSHVLPLSTRHPTTNGKQKASSHGLGHGSRSTLLAVTVTFSRDLPIWVPLPQSYRHPDSATTTTRVRHIIGQFGVTLRDSSAMQHGRSEHQRPKRPERTWKARLSRRHLALRVGQPLCHRRAEHISHCTASRHAIISEQAWLTSLPFRRRSGLRRWPQ